MKNLKAFIAGLTISFLFNMVIFSNNIAYMAFCLYVAFCLGAGIAITFIWLDDLIE